MSACELSRRDSPLLLWELRLKKRFSNSLPCFYFLRPFLAFALHPAGGGPLATLQVHR